MSKKKEDKAIEVTADEDTEEAIKTATAKRLLEPAVQSTLAIECLDDCYNVKYLTRELEYQNKLLSQGSMERASDILLAQAHSLNALSSHMIRKGHSSDYVDHLKAYFNIALKAQNQCRMTLETLSEIKNPKPYIQNNKAQYQQINNNGKLSRAGENSKTTNELLEDNSNDKQWMDTRETQKTIRNDKELETVGK
jgi:hypothetical protein